MFILGLAQTNIVYAAADSTQVASLRDKYSLLQDKLKENQFQKPIYLDSSEKSDSVAGEIYAIINHPFTKVSSALNIPANWCDILILHLNIKYCRALTTNKGTILNVSIGKKHDQPLDKAYRVVFDYYVIAKTYNYLQVKLTADKGPVSTRNYSIMLEAIALENGHTFIHLAYSYSYGFIGRLAMQTYLNTVGRDKVGFTIIDKKSNGEVVYIDGMRGVVERNTMRYYFAIEAFLDALSMPPTAQLEKRLMDWFTATERYPNQLYEMEKSIYLAMKRKEYLRQRTGDPLIAPSAPKITR